MGETVAVVFDIAGLTLINDEYGYDVGDQVIAAERRLRDQTPDDGTTTRIGGGSWLVEMPGPRARNRIVGLTGRMRMRPLPCGVLSGPCTSTSAIPFPMNAAGEQRPWFSGTSNHAYRAGRSEVRLNRATVSTATTTAIGG